VGFEPVIPVFKHSRTVYDSDHEVNI